ncbi:MAG: glycosyltransferase, partial [Candidatus Eisenbacteria bacterium]|nr:glycosyltransferase [Candidatus Latescibacterota bacterium]MBD3302525.1 glycosyltransferase [Candidatus Eisenbacteria bacterium]
LANRPQPGAYRRCVEILRATRTQLLHTHGGTAGFTGRLAARRLGVRSVHTYHGLHYLHFRGVRRMLYETADRLLAPGTERIVCVAESDLRLARRHRLVVEGRAAVVHNGIDPTPFAALPRRARGEGTGPVVGTIGRLHRQKGHRDLVEAAVRVLEEEPSCRFTIVGEGEERGALEREIAAAGLGERFSLPGATHDATAALADFDLFVLPSLWEGLPLTLLEAMAAGLPVIASDVDGIPEAVSEGKDGLLVPPRDPAALARAILGLLRDPDRAARLGAAARRTVETRFTLDRMVRETERVYEEAFHT